VPNPPVDFSAELLLGEDGNSGVTPLVTLHPIEQFAIAKDRQFPIFCYFAIKSDTLGRCRRANCSQTRFASKDQMGIDSRNEVISNGIIEIVSWRSA
jgi:hypothetical protein